MSRRRNRFWKQNALNLALAVALIGGLAQFAIGGGKERLAEKQTHDTAAELKQTVVDDSKDSQKAAEDIFFNQGVAVQAVDRKTHLNNFTIGSVVVAPESITRHNPEGTPIANAYIASQDGTVYHTDPNGIPTLTIGNSARIRLEIIKKGHQEASDQMTQQATKH